MPNLSINTLVIAIGFLCLLAELVIGVNTGFDLVLLGVNFLIGGIVGEALHSWQLGLVIVAVLSILYVFFGRALVKQKLAVPMHKSNVDALVGASGVVVAQIAPHQPGRVRIRNEEWRAMAEATIRKGDQITVDRVEGVSLHVKRVDSRQSSQQ